MKPHDWFDLEGRPKLEHVHWHGLKLRVGDRVRLRPEGRADIMDAAIAGKVATIESIEQDYEEQVHLAVVLEDDPGRDLGLLKLPGHRFFFRLAEVEPVVEGADESSEDARP